MAHDRWPELLSKVEDDDGLPTRDCGPWTEDKLWFWNRYVDIVARSMANHPKWNGLSYVDLFGGPGVCTVKDSGKRLPGSPLIAAMAPKPFAQLQIVELSPISADSLRSRLESLVPDANVQVLQGDCNTTVDVVAERIVQDSLCLAFIDPPNLDIRFETVSKLATGRRADLLILFADAFDIVRNVDMYESGKSDKLDQMFPTSVDWRREWEKIENRTGDNVRRAFADLYKRSLRDELGYQTFRERVIESPRGPLYRLIFASQHKLGGTFWDKVTTRDRGGQQDLFG